MYSFRYYLLFVICSVLFLSCNDKYSDKNSNKIESLKNKKVYYIDSYHESYKPNIKTRTAFENGISGKNIRVKYSFLDAKQITNPEDLKLKAKEIVNSVNKFKADLIVVSDDAAMKYVIEPYLKNNSTPIIFIGINWQYENRSSNMTGQLEVELIDKLISDLKQYSSGTRIGILTAETVTDRKSVKFYKEVLNINFEKEVFVKDFKSWKKEYKNLQTQVDILIVRQNSGIYQWDENLAKEWIQEHTVIPTGSPNFHINKLVLLCYPKMNEEYGEYAAKTALLVLSGTLIKDLPVEKNQRSNITANMSIAKKLGIIFSPDFLDIAHLVTSENKKIAFVNSYHVGYEWSDNLVDGFLKSLSVGDTIVKERYFVNDIEIRMFYMDAKRNPQIEFQKKCAKKIYDDLKNWKPDVIVASDDDAAKWLIVPYLKKGVVPVLFCGLNWDASVYGFPTSNVTGMIEVAPIETLIRFLKQYSKGKRLSYLGADILSERKEIDYYKKDLAIKFSDGALVRSVTAWKKKFLELQDKSDMMILVSHVGIPNWNKDMMMQFIHENTIIPTGTTTKLMRNYVMVTFARIPEEQGVWVGEKAVELLNGKELSNINVSKNKAFVRFVNQSLFKKLDIKISPSLLDSAFFIDEIISK